MHAKAHVPKFLHAKLSNDDTTVQYTIVLPRYKTNSNNQAATVHKAYNTKTHTPKTEQVGSGSLHTGTTFITTKYFDQVLKLRTSR